MSAGVATDAPGEARLEERARWFRSGDDWCVAHWHAARAPVLRRVAILCPSLGSERMRGERAFRVLADRLAARGVSTLRFDYPATGNSTGDCARETDHDLVARWCKSIADAAAHAKELVPGAEFVLIGRRLGALLALEASRSMAETVNRCVLWDPPASGRSFVRELRLREQARFDHRYADELAAEHPIFALQWEGHRFDRRTVEAIERLTLPEVPTAVERVEVVANDPDRAVAALVRATGSDVSTRVTGHRAADAAFDWSVYDGPALPDESLAVIEGCVVDGAPVASEDDIRRDESRVPRVARHGGESDIIEDLVRFGAGGALFGVCASRASGAVARTAALILPTGIEPSSGYGDMWARFARRAAAQGVPSLRVDWRGNGESDPHPDGPENVSYGARRTEDVAEGVAALRARFPGASVVVVGLCSGGYYAVHAAAEGAGADRIIAINPQLYWHEGMPTSLDLHDLAPAVEMQLADGLERAVSDGRKWRRLLSGGYHWRDVLRAARGVAARRGWLPSPSNGDSGLLGGRLPRIDLERLFPGPARTDLVYSDDDFGLPHLQAHGHAAYTALMARPFMRMHLLQGCDHNYSRESMRARLEPLLLEILAEH